MRKILNIALVVFSATSIAELSLAYDSLAYDFVGYAYSLSSDKLLYSEHHSYRDNNNHIVVYREANDDASIFATKTVNYQDNAFAPSFQQSNARNGEFINIQRADNNLTIEYKENQAAAIATQSFSVQTLVKDHALVIDAGFDKFITHHWQDLIAGQKITINYLIPSRLDYYQLSINQYDCQDEHNYCFEISASNFFINLFSSDLKLKYNKESRLLASFTGRSNISDREGNYQDVNIVYEYNSTTSTKEGASL